jgi:hypothetical protein
VRGWAGEGTGVVVEDALVLGSRSEGWQQPGQLRSLPSVLCCIQQ